MSTAFVLTGGGSLGAVQVGMLQALAAAGVEPDLLVGTSAGALNAAWVAVHGPDGGSLAGLESVWTGLRRRDVFPVDPRALVRGLIGTSPAVTSPDRLARLVATYAGTGDLSETRIPLHLVATDVISGRTVSLSTGSLSTAVLASAAIPAVFPPVLHDGRTLVDGGVGEHTGVSQAIRLGADTVYVLPAGNPCALPAPPSSAVGMAVHALSLLIQQRLAREVAELVAAEAATIRVLPPLCPLRVSASDFGHAAELIGRSRRRTTDWIRSGAVDLPDPHRFLGLHGHHHGERDRFDPAPGWSGTEKQEPGRPR